MQLSRTGTVITQIFVVRAMLPQIYVIGGVIRRLVSVLRQTILPQWSNIRVMGKQVNAETMKHRLLRLKAYPV